MTFLHTSVCDVLGIEVPILQASIGKSQGTQTTPELVAAVSEAGGMGFIGGAGLEPDAIRATIRKVRKLTKRPFGLGLLFPANLAEAAPTRDDVRAQIERDYPKHLAFMHSLLDKYGLTLVKMPRKWVISPELTKAQVDVVIDESVPVLAAGLGDPSWVVPRAHAANIKVIGLAGTVRNALRHQEAGVDLIVAQGHEAGGHSGAIASFALIPQVVDAVRPIPVLAAGGIADGRGVAAALALGASGVWCGTAFLFASETELSTEFRKQLAAGRAEDFVQSKSYTGKPARGLRNEITEAWSKSGLDLLPMPHQWVLMDDLIASAEAAGRQDLLQNCAGQIAGMLSNTEPAAKIVERMATEANAVIAQLGAYTGQQAVART